MLIWVLSIRSSTLFLGSRELEMISFVVSNESRGPWAISELGVWGSEEQRCSETGNVVRL